MRAWLLALAGCWTGSEAPPPAKSVPAPVVADAPTRETCLRLLEHMIDLEFAKAGTGDASQKRAVVDAKSNEFATACMKTPRARIDCALAATTIDGVAKCDGR